jgi:anti-sigma regulatory factor (Ser/Thr protein kinase)
MVMAAARSVLRATAAQVVSPGETLQRVNDFLCPDIPDKMFVTCLYGVLDVASGRFCFANAGHNLPYARTAGGAVELRATGMPLGLLPGMGYEETEATIGPGEALLLYSDGVTEAHGAGREMYGTPRLAGLVAGDDDLIAGLLGSLQGFTGAGWEQEDDITLVTLRRADGNPGRGLDVTFRIGSRPGNEREAMERVAAVVAPLGLEPRRLEGLKTAVAEAAMNAIEHGNQGREELPIDVEVKAAGGRLVVRISDEGLGGPVGETEAPDLDAKLAGLQKPRGWGLFLIENMVDELRVSDADGRHTVELVLNTEGGGADGDR